MTNVASDTPARIPIQTGGGDFMSNLSLPGIFESEDERIAFDRENLSQWFTPPDLALRIVRWAGDVTGYRILEPSAGSGALVRALIACSVDARNIDAVELDPRWYDILVANEDFAGVRFEHGNYLMRAAPARRYDIAIMNPPYEGGLDGLFLEKAMNECDRVVALLRVVVKNGLDRHKRVWSRCAPGGDFRMVGDATIVSRPDFGGDIGAKADFAVFKLARRELLSVSFTYEPEWWR